MAEEPFDYLASIHEDVREALRLLGAHDSAGAAAMLAEIEMQFPRVYADRDTLRATVAGLTTACETALGHILRSNWKGKDARTALIALSDALAATPAPDGRRDTEKE